jgi:AraC-like DNA-binding protein
MKATLLSQILFWNLFIHQIFVIAILLSRREVRYDHCRAMAVFFAANVITSIPFVPQMLGYPDPFPGFDAIGMPFLMLMGPTVFFYARALVSPASTTFSRADINHLLPFAVALLLVAELIILQSGVPQPPPLSLKEATGRQLAVLVIMLALIALFVGATSIYLLRVLKLLARYRRTQFDHFSSVEGRSLSWMEIMMVVLVVSWGLTLLLLIDDLSIQALSGNNLYAMIIETSWVYALSFMVLWQQVIYQPGGAALAVEDDIPEPTAKYHRSALDEERRARIAAKIELAMTRDHLYRNQSLTLRNLSDHTRVSENYLSQVLNETLGRNFYEYINHWRIKEAQALLAQDRLSIIEVGEDVGFNSRSTFNAAFRKETGMAPSEYRAQAEPIARQLAAKS